MLLSHIKNLYFPDSVGLDIRSMKVHKRIFNCFLRYVLIGLLSIGSVGVVFAQSTPVEAESSLKIEKPLTDKERWKLAREAKAAEKKRLAAEKKAKKALEKEQKKKEKENKKKYSITKFFLETPQGSQTVVQEVEVYRAYPEKVYIGTREFLDDRDFKEVNVVDSPDGTFQIEFVLNSDGASILQNITTRYRGRRMIVFANFGDPRYLGAPKIDRTITDGIVRITPDASREEAERFVLGMKNTIHELKRKNFGL